MFNNSTELKNIFYKDRLNPKKLAKREKVTAPNQK
ncbi:hypothetical protein H0A61_02031 [Koleobacter methoxysyntrophicus]|uniref:Uncharacterized protein n=1 Tax=Koleobacter methoxysyntrophicus TaxID=2751313 RepID=A0A8A0RP27_9FIRM|nr:hypothetical protein H0A61_02031 [Koleobacter methoxysyntrophicus]